MSSSIDYVRVYDQWTEGIVCPLADRPVGVTGVPKGTGPGLSTGVLDILTLGRRPGTPGLV